MKIYQYYPGMGISKSWEYRFNIDNRTAAVKLQGILKTVDDTSVKAYAYKRVYST